MKLRHSPHPFHVRGDRRRERLAWLILGVGEAAEAEAALVELLSD